MWELAGDDYNHDASDDGYGRAATGRYAHDDYNDAYGRRLLVAEAGRRLRLFSRGGSRILKSRAESDRAQPNGYQWRRAQDF